MLAYDLYLKNKNYEFEFTGPGMIKKIFVYRNNDKNQLEIKIDDTTLSQYGINENDKNLFQNIFQMPEKNKAKLPYKSTGSNSPKPYIEIEGKFESRKSKSKITLYFGKKDNKEKSPQFMADLLIDNNKNIENDNINQKFVESIDAKNRLKIKLNKTDYRIKEDMPIYDLYKNFKIINEDSLESAFFEQISREFFRFIKSKWIDDLSNTKDKTVLIRFSLVILPSTKTILYFPKSESTKTDDKKTIDSFGNETFGYPIETTQNAKFLSFDDPAFSLNCKTKSEFYQNLSIGKTSFKSINIPADIIFNISGLNWIFTDLNDFSYEFKKTHKGIYYQLLSNYLALKEKSGDSVNQACMKIICFDKNQAKLEILLDDNLTMQAMRKIFQKFNDTNSINDIPINALELLIDKGGNGKNIWSMYINAVQSILHEKSMNKDLVQNFIIKKIQAQIFNWIVKPKNNYEIKDFFQKSEFCLKILTTSNSNKTIMNGNEEYAYKMGLIAGRYISFKKNADEQSNSLKDILTYSKYDREKLRYVWQRIGLGINLSDSNESNMKNIYSFIKQNYPSNEIDDNNANKDYSYFFYKGVFYELC